MSADGKEENPDPDHILLPSGQLLTALAMPGGSGNILQWGVGRTQLPAAQSRAPSARNTVVTQRYTIVNLLRTIEDILGLQHLSIYTATQPPITEVFDLSKREWTYDAVPSLFCITPA
jgi:hypothetical protein